jgi:nucleoside-diphosphate-sugar epimerase
LRAIVVSAGESQSPVLVTEAAAFIGMHAARRLLESGQPVISLVNLNDY